MSCQPMTLNQFRRNLANAESLFAQQESVVQAAETSGLASDLAVRALDVMWDLLCTFRNTAELHEELAGYGSGRPKPD